MMDCDADKHSEDFYSRIWGLGSLPRVEMFSRCLGIRVSDCPQSLNPNLGSGFRGRSAWGERGGTADAPSANQLMDRRFGFKV